MKMMKLQALIVTLVLIANSHGYSISDYDYDYYADEMGATEVDCYIRVTLSNCNEAFNLRVHDHQTDTDTKYAISGKAKSACLKVKCTSNKLSGTLDIGEEHEQSGDIYVANANPGTLNPQNTNGLYTTDNKCKSGKVSISTVTCVDEKKSKSQDNSVQVDELEKEALNGNNDNEDFPMRNENEKENDAFMMNNGDSRYPPPANFDDEDGHAQVQVLDDKSMQQDDDDDDTSDDNDSKGDKPKLSDAQEKILVKEGITAKLQWCNWFRSTLYVHCGSRQAIYWVQSWHSHHYQDRIWYFRCTTVADYNFNHCYWTGNQNRYDGPLLSHCASDHVVRGIYSHYSYRHRDRKFQFLCCRAPHHYTRHCSLSGYVNGWEGYMHYGVYGRRAFTGLFSTHGDGGQDRMWKIASCYYSR